MTGLTLAAMLHASILMTTSASGTQNAYNLARKECNDTGRPMIVLVGAKWCPACVDMKDHVVPKLRKRGLLRKVAFALVDLDRQKKLGHRLIQGGPIPQLIMYRKTKSGWRRQQLIGGQSVETAAAFIQEGIRLKEKDDLKAKGSPKAKDAPKAKTGAKTADQSNKSAPKPAAKKSESQPKATDNKKTQQTG